MPGDNDPDCTGLPLGPPRHGEPHELNELLDSLKFNQVVIFVNFVQRVIALHKLLVE